MVARGPEWTWKVQPLVGKRRCWSASSVASSMVVQSVNAEDLFSLLLPGLNLLVHQLQLPEFS